MRVAVTGGSGVVGGAVVRLLVEAGHDVRALARSQQAAEKLTGSGSRPLRGDVLDMASLAELVKGTEWVFHVAGVNEFCSKDPDRMDRVNIEGTSNVIATCRQAGVGRMVHTSSAVTLGEQTGEIGSESTEHRGYYRSRYERSKHLSERLVLGSSGDLDAVVVNPSSVQGPGRTTGTGKLILDAVRGQLPFIVDTTLSIVDIDDCARGHLLAAEKGDRGERYVLSGFTMTVTEAFGILERMVGRSVSPRTVPPWIATVGGALVEAGARLLGKQPPVCREMIRTIKGGAAYDGSLATRRLGLHYTPRDETIARTIAWFEAEGLLV